MQAYGREGILQECLFVLFSFQKNHTPEEQRQVIFHIYTDQPGWFTRFTGCPLEVHYHELAPATIQQWRGGIDFVHRVKIEVLRDFLKSHQGNVLYLDTDVYFKGSLLPFFRRMGQRELFMHVSEGRLDMGSNPMMKKLHRFFHQKNTFNTGSQTVTIPPDAEMWNAGVLGFHSSYAPVVDEVLAFTDAAYREFPKHIIEQFAFTYFLGRQGQLHHTAQTIVHYWILSEVKAVLGSFFDYFKDCSWDELLRYSALVQYEVLVQEKASFFINRSIGGKMRKLSWQPALPDWTELLKQM